MADKAPRIKICGITRPEEAAMLSRAGADYAGFVFYEKSRRNITLEDALRIKEMLPPSIKAVAVTVSPTPEQVSEICRAGFYALQVHAEFSDEAAGACDIPIWRAWNIESAEAAISRGSGFADPDVGDGLPAEMPGIEAYVLDAANFGSGKAFDWSGAEKVRGMLRGRRLVLAGGLTPENVAEGIRLFSPDVVDVSSGVERPGGGKDEEKIMRFVREVRQR